jgi:hypothetical protein
MSAKTTESIPLSVLDCVLYGGAKAVEYLGLRGERLLYKVGDGILDYCIKAGYVQPSKDMQQTVGIITNFFIENGYASGFDFKEDAGKATLTFRGWRYLGLMKKLKEEQCQLLACPLCVAGIAIFRANGVDVQVISDAILPDGTVVRSARFTPLTNPDQVVLPSSTDVSNVKAEWKATDRVGLHAFEAVEYGLAQGFDYLGAQAQLLLDNVGAGIIEFLQDEFQVSLPDEPAKTIEKLASFFAANEMADRISCEVSLSAAKITFAEYRYAPVLRRLLAEGVSLVSCPFTLAARTSLRQRGLAVGDMEWEFMGERDVSLNMPLLKIADQQFDEEKVASLMDAK